MIILAVEVFLFTVVIVVVVVVVFFFVTKFVPIVIESVSRLTS